MEHIVKFYKGKYETIDDYLKNCKLIKVEDRTFGPVGEVEEMDYDMSIDPDNREIIDNLMAEYSLPIEWKLLYLHTKQNNISIVTQDEFEFYSLENLTKQTDYYKKCECQHIIDLGHQYIGMGHLIVMFWDKRLKKIMFRRDGGSNGFERIDAFFRYIGIPDDIEKIYEGKVLDPEITNLIELKREYNWIKNRIFNPNSDENKEKHFDFMEGLDIVKDKNKQGMNKCVKA